MVGRAGLRLGWGWAGGTVFERLPARGGPAAAWLGLGWWDSLRIGGCWGLGALGAAGGCWGLGLVLMGGLFGLLGAAWGLLGALGGCWGLLGGCWGLGLVLLGAAAGAC